MTIDECLEIAQRRLSIADRQGDGECAAIAQAAALVAQAIMAYETHKVEMMRHRIWIDNTFGEQIDPGEEVRVTVAFAGDIFDDETPA
jgi:hypothetical protein